MAAFEFEEHFLHVEAFIKPALGMFAPVIEIACDNQGFMMRHMTFDTITQGFDLAVPFDTDQTEMDTNHMQDRLLGKNPDPAVQQASAGPGKGRYIDILPALEREFTQDRVAVMARVVNRVLAIGIMRPYAIGNEFELRAFRPAHDRFSVSLMFALHFLQK